MPKFNFSFWNWIWTRVMRAVNYWLQLFESVFFVRIHSFKKMRFSKSSDFPTRLISLSNIKCIFHLCISHHSYSLVPNTLSPGLKRSVEGDWIWFSWEWTGSVVLIYIYKKGGLFWMGASWKPTKSCFMYASTSYRSADYWRCSVKKVFLKISQNSPENVCARASFLLKLQAKLMVAI